ncbi:phenolphthiocerol/phthiocerol polyketide synthase subunit C [Corythoichthys intestinalis]|uniref:phenolphthiocerol/phthiocerol polyketide synthase subunit C n=1 Tax=Corythoichthys intestinalis TaxID=161448 RepID=UPI0025A5188D|nr:phenolphthiocerol/phthiocerol polyketide synthase subunit C [Corythoichthys intestinalis]XP_061810204.1 phenolphthiocerol/phthiocerol polyketide synthase subunit C-like [Nerophis lumbriciformis]
MDEPDLDIAVIGIGCNFPGGEGLENFWRVLLEGQNCVVDIPIERFDVDSWYDPDGSKPGKTQTAKAALIDGLNEFDHNFFGMLEAEADVMDPQHKLLLQCTLRALEDASIPMERISGSRTGVYIGLMNRDYEILRSNSPASINHYNATGTAMSMAANRISYTFNLTGPSFAVDSACSSSLVALHLACQAIRQGDCEMALCGGVNCILEPQVFVALSKARMISPQGTSKPFSSQADGYGRGEGCGVVLLKPLRNALRDCNKIWGIVAKTSINQDGRSVSPITKPSSRQQEELLRQIYLERDLADVQYIEAHGTGTPVGDPTEATSISNAVAKARSGRKGALWIGSVKGNIGHTESAAGVAGLIKVLLMMKHQTIVPSVFYSRDCANIDPKVMGISIPTEAEKWTTNGSWDRVAGINSFGFGGTNSHVIVREYNQTTNLVQIPKDGPKVFVASAASEKSLIRCLSDTHRRLLDSEAADVHSLAYTSACGRSHSKHKYRKVVITSTLPNLQQQLASLPEAKVISAKPEVVFVFSGNGVAFRGMCNELFSTIPIFKDKVMEAEVLFQKKNRHIGISQYLSGELEADLSRPDVVQPLLFAIQVALAALLKHWGVKPNAALGHSLGEVSAAHCSGLLSLEDAVNVVYHRSVLQSSVTVGKMLVVSNILLENVLKILQDFSKNVSVAAFNSPRSFTLSGDEDAVDLLRDKLQSMYADEIFLHTLDVTAAYHSHLMDPILEDIESILGDLAVSEMECDLFSTVTGDKYAGGDFGSGSYWAKNIREPVLFEQTLRAVTKDNQSRRKMVLLEIGPRRALQKYIHETLGNEFIVLSSVQPHEEYESILSTVGKLFELGVDVSWETLYRGYETPPTAFPRYHFDHTKKEMYFDDVRKVHDLSSSLSHPLISPIRENNKEYVCNLTAAYLAEHKHNGIPVVPGAFYVELALASVLAYMNLRRSVSCVQLSVTFHHLLSTDGRELKVRLEETKGLFTMSSSAATHASGTFRCSDGPAVVEEPTICPDGILKRCTFIVTTKEFYSILARAGFEYGSVFKQLNDVHFGDEFQEVATTLRVPKELIKNLQDYVIHPVLLDYFLQMTAAVASRDLPEKRGFPTAIGSVVVSGPLPEEMFIYMRATEKTPNLLKVCGCLATKDGKVLVELQDVQIKFLGGSSHVPPSVFFHNETIPIPSKSNCGMKIRALIFADKLGIAEALGPYLHPESHSVEDKENWTTGQLRDVVLGNDSMRDVLFIWPAEDLSYLSAPSVLDRLVACCESFRQIVLALKERKQSCTVRVITYRSTENMVDCVSSGFALSGMIKACAAEVPGISFQLIDLKSLTATDIQSLVGVITSCKQAEVIVGQGQMSTTKITRTQILDKVSLNGDLKSVRDFVLQTSHPYRVEGLTATSIGTDEETISDKSVEVQLTNVCVHSSDYFPVTLSHLRFGNTLYWNTHTAHHHTLLALDFSGIVTAVGKDVRHLRAGDRIAASYPTATATRVVVPDSVCYDVEKLPFLKECPSVSFFILAWEILQRTLPAVKPRQKKMSIVTPDLASVFTKVLALTANRSGWNVSCVAHLSTGEQSPDPCHALVFLPPFDESWQDLSNYDLYERHLVYVCGTGQSFPRWPLKSSFLQVYVINVTHVLQRIYLKSQGTTIFKWLSSLGFDRASLPIKIEAFPISNRAKDQIHESYFSTKTVRQVVLETSVPNCQLSDIVLLSKPRRLFNKCCTYIVSGGLTGLGFETVKFIARNGGGCIVTLSRRMPTSEMQSELDVIQKRYNITIVNIQCDVSVSQQVEEAVTKTEESLRRAIKGVFHSAAVLHDAPIETLNRSLLLKVLQPKVSGALNLHHATLDKKLDFFVCYSSISSLVGNESQSNYAAANSFLDKFCLYRRNLGLAGQSVNWGPLNLGLLLNKKHIQRHLEAKGMTVMEVGEIHEALAQVLLTNRPQQLVCKFNFRKPFLRERLPGLVEAELKDQGSDDPPLPQLSPPLECVRRIICEVLNFSEGELDLNAALGALGVDSMSAVTLQSKITQATGVNVPLVMLLDLNTTVATLESFVVNNNVM